MREPPGHMGTAGACEFADASSDLVSIIVPCYGQAHYLGEALDSVLAQSHAQLEVIVVDDGSPDDTAIVAGEYAARDARVRLLRQENRGLSGARNAGLAGARGAYVVFLDADDLLCPGALARGLEALRADPAAAFAAGRFEFVNHEGDPIGNPLAIGTITGEPYEALLRVNQIACPAMVMYRRSTFDAVGTFDQSVSPAEDYDLYLRIVRTHAIRAHDAIVARYRQHGAGLSANSASMGRAVLAVMERQRPYVAASPALRRAHRNGVRFWKRFYLARAARFALGRVYYEGDWALVRRDFPLVLRWGAVAMGDFVTERVWKRPRELRAARRIQAAV